MKFTVALITVLSVTSTWAIKAKIDDAKDKRDAAGEYSPSSHTNSYQGQALSQDEGNAISVGAGYSVGSAKPSYTYAAQGAGVPYQLQSEGQSASGHGIQLPPITLQSEHGGLVSSDLSQLMNELSHGISTGAITLPGGGAQGPSYQIDNQGLQGGHGGQISLPQFSFGSPKYSQYSLGEQGQAALPVYATGTKGLGNYGSTGPVLFTPQSYSNQPAHAAPSSGQSYESAAISLGEGGQSFPGFSLGGAAAPGGAYKAFPGNYVTSGKASFKPSTFVGASVPSESGHSVAGGSGSYSVPSFAGYQSPAASLGGYTFSSGGHGHKLGSLGFGGSGKQIASPSNIEGVGSLQSIASAFSASGQLGSPPRTTYGIPASAYPSSNVHAASVHAPQFYISSSKYPSSASFGAGSSAYKAPATSHSSLSSYSLSPKYSFGGHSSHYSPKDTQGSYSESAYNTIKYSEELKPRAHHY